MKRDEISRAHPSHKAFSARSNLDSTVSCSGDRTLPDFARRTGQEERTPRDLAALCEHVVFSIDGRDNSLILQPVSENFRLVL